MMLHFWQIYPLLNSSFFVNIWVLTVTDAHLILPRRPEVLHLLESLTERWQLLRVQEVALWRMWT